jgi:diaminopimelate epimerase
VAVAGVLTGRTGRDLTLHLLGGDLHVRWPEGGHVLLTGPCVEVFEGRWPLAGV